MKTKKYMQKLHSHRQAGAAETFCDARLAKGCVTLALDDLVEKSGLSALAAKRQLSRLRGKVARVSPRQPFYLIVGPEHRGLGAPPPEWWLQDYFDWLGRPYYVALQSAAGLLGSNPQAVQTMQVMTDRPCRAIKVGKIHVRFFVKREIQQTPIRQLAGAEAPLCVSTPEATAHDLIRYAVSLGGIERAAETIRPLLPLMRVRELRRALAAGAEISAAQRLGFVIEACGNAKLAKTIRDWLPRKPAPVLLVPKTGESRADIPLAVRWQVFNNSRELKI